MAVDKFVRHMAQAARNARFRYEDRKAPTEKQKPFSEDELDEAYILADAATSYFVK